MSVIVSRETLSVVHARFNERYDGLAQLVVRPILEEHQIEVKFRSLYASVSF